MNVEIAEIIKSKITGAWYVDTLVGLVKRVVKVNSVSYEDENGQHITETVEKSFPAYCQLSLEECESGDYMDLVPNDTKASIMYFEDGGCTFLDSQSNMYEFESNLRLVGWFNMKRFTATGCSLSQYVVPQIIAAIPKSPFNDGNFQRIRLVGASEQAKDGGIFSRYTYDEPKTQYLMYPFDFFAIDLRIRFTTNKVCFTEFEIQDAPC